MSSVSLKHGGVTPVENVTENMYLQQLPKEDGNETKSFASLDRSCVSVRQQNGQSIRCVRVAPKDDAPHSDHLWRNYTGNDKETCAKSSGCCGSELSILRKLVAALFFVSFLTLLLTLLVISGKVKAKSMYCSCENKAQQEGGDVLTKYTAPTVLLKLKEVERNLTIIQKVYNATTATLVGPPGPPGRQGPPGTKGSAGSQGPEGPQGPRGQAGAEGPLGPVGIRGPQGPAGPQGEHGPMGPPGERGAMGPRGYNGSSGPPGSPGAPCNSSQASAGSVGLPGAPGPRGPPGERGVRGQHGPQGKIGTGNLTTCKHVKKEAVAHTAGSVAEADCLVREDDFPGWKITGVSCSTKHAEEYFLTSVVDPADNVVVYKCRCVGNSDLTNSGAGSAAKCFMHLWMCPVIM